jgi:hypothetical protein
VTVLTEAPAGAKVLDLGAAQAARQEARAAAGEPNPVIKLTAGYVEMKSEIPLVAAVDLNAGDLRGGLGGLLSDPADVDVLLSGITATDVSDLVQFITGSLTLGESSASPAS